MSAPIRPHPKNAPGSFYVEHGCCVCCDVPFAEAPELFAYDETNHCYVKRQPMTKDELNRMISVAWMSEVQCIRYCGQDADVLRRFAELGEPHLCDVAPPSNIEAVVRNHVTFDAADSAAMSLTPRDLAAAFQEHLRLKGNQAYVFTFTPIVERVGTATFALSWYQGRFHTVEFRALSQPQRRWLSVHSPVVKPGSRGVSLQIYDWLRNDPRFRDIRWYTEEQWRGSKEWRETPW
jgi:hypothetical protein